MQICGVFTPFKQLFNKATRKRALTADVPQGAGATYVPSYTGSGLEKGCDRHSSNVSYQEFREILGA